MSLVAFDPVGDVIHSLDTLSRPAWGDSTVMTNFYTPYVNDNAFYADVYREIPTTNPLARPQFSLTYGHLAGSGSAAQLVDGTKSTRQIYGQYQSLLLRTETQRFDFGGDSAIGVSDELYAISVARSCFRERFRAGSFNLRLTTGSFTLSLTDDSRETASTNYLDTNRFYYVVSGSNGQIAPGTSRIATSKGSYGLVFPDMGLILLNPMALALPTSGGGMGLQLLRSSTTPSNNNVTKLISLIQTGGYFSLMSEETIASTSYVVRVKNNQFNHTQNPTVVDDTGNLIYQELIDNPVTYITGIGLYNDRNELVAIAKSSKPVKKDFNDDFNFTVRLPW